MAKAISSQLQAHLKRSSTTLATCWKITRQDGKVFGFTEHDRDITFQNLLFKSRGGFNKTSITSSGTFSVNGTEVNGFLEDDTIPDEELRNGAFDYAEVEIFVINYEDLSMGSLALRNGYFGEVRTAPSGAFLVELRGLIQLLTQKIGQIYVPECRVDLGSTQCGIVLQPQERAGGRSYAQGARVLFPVDDLVSHTPPVDAGLVNPSFEDDLIGWSQLLGEAVIIPGNFNLQPLESGKFVLCTTIGVYQTLNIANGPLTTSLIDAGGVVLDGDFLAAAYEYRSEVKVDVAYFSSLNGTGSVVGSRSYTPGLEHPLRSWKRHHFQMDVPINARSVKITFSARTTQPFAVAGTCFDDIHLKFLLDDVELTFQKYGGVEFEAQSAGVTAAVAPDFDSTLGNTTEDGTVTWKAVAPTHTFLAEVVSDMVYSNKIVISGPAASRPSGWFDWGVVEFLTGHNIGRRVEAYSWDNASSTLTLALPVPRAALTGDLLRIQTGCDKRRSTCSAKFANILNFRAEPDIPGNGEYFKVAGT